MAAPDVYALGEVWPRPEWGLTPVTPGPVTSSHSVSSVSPTMM